MIVMAINHDAEDYERWKAVFDEFPPSKGGALFHRVNRNVDNPNNIAVVSGEWTRDRINARLSELRPLIAGEFPLFQIPSEQAPPEFDPAPDT